MADNGPVEAHLEVDPLSHDPTPGQVSQKKSGTVSKEGQVASDEPVNASASDERELKEPKEPGVSEPPTAPNGDEADEGPVATISGQVSDSAPLDNATPNRAESQTLSSTPSAEISSGGVTSVATPTPTKRFTSMNINKKFLAKASAGSSGSSNTPTAPKASTSASATRPAPANPQPSSRLVTKKLTTTVPVSSASGGWSLRPTPPASLSSSPAPGDVSTGGQAKPLLSTDVSNRPILAPSASVLSVDSRSSAKTSRDHSPVKAWATVPVSVGDIRRNLQDFPTAAEAAADSTESKRPGVSASQPTQPTTDTTAHGTDNDARDSFRGMHLDPNAHHWDEMEDESNDFLGEVIDFGDGKTYTVPPEDSEPVSGPSFSKETRLGDDYDRSWPRSRPTLSESDAAQSSRVSQHHGHPPRPHPGDGRVLFNERSNRLEPARASHSTTGTFHQHAPPFAHLPPRSTVRRNSGHSSSDRPKVNHAREPPPHTRDLPPHASAGFPPDDKPRRLSDARSTHSPVERRSSFLHDERPRMGAGPLRNRAGDEVGYGLRCETSRDSRLSVGERQPWGQQAPGRRASVESSHQTNALDTGSNRSPMGPVEDSASGMRSPLQRTSLLPTGAPSSKDLPSVGAPEPTNGPVAPTVLNEEREKFMKQAAERARRRKQEEEAAREEARERARKKAAELEALSKASLVTASPLVALTRQSSGAKSPAPKSPIPKSPLAAQSLLPPAPTIPEASSKPEESQGSTGAAAPSWRTGPKTESNADERHESSQTILSSLPVSEAQKSHILLPPTTTQLGGLGGMQPMEELGKADGPIEVLDFSDMSKLAGRRTSITSSSEPHRRKRSVVSDFLDEAPTKRPGQGQANAWSRDTRSSSENYENRDRTGTSHGKHTSTSHKQVNEGAWPKSTPSTTLGLSSTTSRPGFKEAPISALDDVMSRIKGVLTDMHAEGEKPATLLASTSGSTTTVPASASTSALPPKASQRVAPRWVGDEVANWRDSMGKKGPSRPPVEAQPTEPFATTRSERPDTPPTSGTFVVRLSKSTVARPPMPKKQAGLAKLPPMPVRWDILTWDPPVERMSTKTLSRDDMLFPRAYLRGVIMARVLLPSTSSAPEAQLKQNGSIQRSQLPATVDNKISRSPNVSTRSTPKGPAFMDTQWRKPPVASPLSNVLELQRSTSPSVIPIEGNQLETTSRSPPPYHQQGSEKPTTNIAGSMPSSSSKGPLIPSQSTEVIFHRSLHEKRPSNPPTVSFTVSSELDDPSATEMGPQGGVVPDSLPRLEVNGAISKDETEILEPSQAGEILDKSEQTISGGKTTQSPTPNSSVLLTPPVKVTTPWQASNSRLPDTEYLKSVWQHASPKEATAENSLRGLTDDFPSAIPHSVQEMKTEDEEPKSSQAATSTPSRMPHNAHRAFQQVPTSPAPMNVQGYVNHMGSQVVPSRPMPVSSFSLPPPAPQITSQPTPYSPYVHPTPPALMYGMPPNRIAPSPAPGGPPMWVQGQAYGRPSPPAGMYPPQQGHPLTYPSPVSQLPPLSKQHGGMNGNHGHHPMSSPAMTHAMHMGSPAMAHVGHMGSPALAHATPHMPVGPQHMYPGMNSPVGLGLGGNMAYGARGPTPQMMQQSPMQAPVSNGYPIVPGGPYAHAGYGRGAIRTPSDGVPHHMPLPHPPHAPVSPGTYHPSAYGRW